MTITEYMRVIADKVDNELKRNNHEEAIRLTTLLRDTINDKLRDWKEYYNDRA